MMKNASISAFGGVSTSSEFKADGSVDQDVVVVLWNTSNGGLTESSWMSCLFCRETFETYDAFKSHSCCTPVENSIDMKKSSSYKCTRCNITHTSVSLLQKHLDIHRTFKCHLCAGSFMTELALVKHFILFHRFSKVIRECVQLPTPNEESKSENNGKKSENCDKSNKKKCKTSNNLPFEEPCKHCNKVFKYKYQYDRHMMGHEQNYCTPCKISLPTKKLLHNHQRIVHGKEDKLHRCTICDKMFQRPKHLLYHQQIHTGEKPIYCHTCRKSFGNKYAFLRHKKTACHTKGRRGDGVASEKPFSCEECDSRFSLQQTLTRHKQLMHRSTKLFQCNCCQYSTKYETNLKRHIKSHEDIKPFMCELCGTSFKYQQSLLDHKAYVHNKERDFVCEKCSKAFTCKSALQRHFQSHSDDRPFKCHCSQAYKRMSHLKRHMASAHQTKVPLVASSSVETKVLPITSSGIYDSHALQQHNLYSSHFNKVDTPFLLDNANFKLDANFDELSKLNTEECPSYFSAISQAVLDSLKDSVAETIQTESPFCIFEGDAAEGEHLNLLSLPTNLEKMEIVSTSEEMINDNPFLSPSKISLPASPLYFQASDFDLPPEECESILNASFAPPQKSFSVDNNTFDLPMSQIELLSSSLECPINGVNSLLSNSDWISSQMSQKDYQQPPNVPGTLHSCSLQNPMESSNSSFLFSNVSSLEDPVPLADINFYTTLYVD